MLWVENVKVLCNLNSGRSFAFSVHNLVRYLSQKVWEQHDISEGHDSEEFYFERSLFGLKRALFRKIFLTKGILNFCIKVFGIITLWESNLGIITISDNNFRNKPLNLQHKLMSSLKLFCIYKRYNAQYNFF